MVSMKAAFLVAVALGVVACGSSDSGSSGTGGAAGSGGTGGASQHTCAELATCCGSKQFTDAVAAPGSKISQKQCDDVSTGTDEQACSALYNGYQLLKDCP